jgi:hypothetical protein
MYVPVSFQRVRHLITPYRIHLHSFLTFKHQFRVSIQPPLLLVLLGPHLNRILAMAFSGFLLWVLHYHRVLISSLRVRCSSSFKPAVREQLGTQTHLNFKTKGADFGIAKSKCRYRFFDPICFRNWVPYMVRVC